MGIEDHDRGLTRDLQTLGRRQALGLFGGLSLAVLTGCATGSSTGAAATSSTASFAAGSTTAAAADCVAEIPDETAGPYPGDGSNGPNALTESGIVRSEITASFGSSTTKAEGVLTTVILTVQDTAAGCSALAGAAVYLWHCDRAGKYSMYDIEDENYLRGVQETDANGQVTYKTIFPAAYSGRWPHMHFELYASLSEATAAGQIVKTSQLALPQDACEAVYATSGYEQSVSNLAQTSLQRDNVFGDDGVAYQIGAVTGSVSDGYSVSLTVPV